MRTSLLTLLGFAAGAAITIAASAQNATDGIDLAALRVRAAQNAADAEALAAIAKKRSEALQHSAQSTADQGQANATRYTEAAQRAAPKPSSDVFDFDMLVAEAGTLAKADMGAAPRFIAFASTSMPKAALKAMLRDVTKAGGIVVFRGLPGGSATGFTAALRQVLEPDDNAEGIGIDPRLFRAFAITAVPTYVMTASDFDLCDGFDCVTTSPPHDRIAGNVSAHYALETFARGQGPGARLAALHLARLEGEAP